MLFYDIVSALFLGFFALGALVFIALSILGLIEAYSHK